MEWMFLNGSPNAKGHTASLAQYLLAPSTYSTINLVEHHVAQLGQQRQATDDDFDALASQMAQADQILIGTPIYWSDMTGLLKAFFDRCTLVARKFDFSQTPVYLLVNGTDDPAHTAQGIEPAVRQLTTFLQMELADTFYVDTSQVSTPDQYAVQLSQLRQICQGNEQAS